jgi:hypothetical protein
MVDWRQHTDYLRCSPQFFGAPRFDCVFIRVTPTKVIFGCLLFLFECTVGKHTFPLALVHPYDAPTGIRLRKDKNFNLFRVRARTRAQSQFFSVRSIIRGALLVPDGPSDYLVIDTVDTDMFGTARCGTFRHYPSAFILVLTIDRLWSTLMCRQRSCIVGKHRCVDSGHVSKPTFTASSQHSQPHSYLPVLLFLIF